MESDSDRLAMLQGLGEEVYIDSCSTWCVFESPFYEYELERELEGSRFMATVRTSDVTAVTRGSEVIRGEVTYSVVGMEPDGEGMTILRLSE